MNWFVEKYRPVVSQNQLDEVEDHCEHIVVGGGGWYTAEMDSFGPVSNYLCCDKCHEEAERTQADRDEVETEVCHDCKQEVPRKDVYFWKWYDFYAPQGDEPLCICKECWSKEKHKARRAKDQADYEEEMGYSESSCPEDEEVDGFYGWFIVVKGSYDEVSGWAEFINVNNTAVKVNLWEYQGFASRAEALKQLPLTAKKHPTLMFEVIERK